MKTPQKGGNSAKGKSRLSLKKKQQPHTITSLFKKQLESSDKDKKLRSLCKNDDKSKTSDDDDVQIVHVELKADKYFSSSKFQVSDNALDRTGKADSFSGANKMKLRRQRSSLTSRKSSLEDTEGRCSEAAENVDSLQVTCKDESFSKALEPSQSSQKENAPRVKTASGGASHDVLHLSRKLSLRKRQSTCDESSLASKPAKLKKVESIESSSKIDNRKPRKSSRNIKTEIPHQSSTKIAENTHTSSAKTEPLESNTNAEISNDLVLNTESDSLACATSGTCADQIFSEESMPSTCKVMKKLNEDDLDADADADNEDDDDDNTDASNISLGHGDSRVGNSDGENDDEDENDADDKSKYRDRTPYYLENFNIIMNSVLDDPDYVRLFNDEDMKVVNCFKGLSEPAQKLYVRLFSRKLAWLMSHKIKYTEIADDLTPVLREMISAKLAVSASDLDDLETVLRILPAAHLKTLAKSFNISLSGLTKPQLIEALLKQSKQNTIGSFFTKRSKGGASVMLRRAKDLLGESFRLQEEPRAVFIRVLMLFSLMNYQPDEENASGGQGQLFQMLLVNMGKLVYPKYTLSKQTSIFQDREDLLRFTSAMLLENDLFTYTDRGDYKGACELYLNVKADYETLIEDDTLVKWDQGLPAFLRRYTAREVYTRILSEGVEILQRLRQYPDAVEQLRSLLQQKDYCLKYRGHWYDRLALNLDQHLHQSEQSLMVIKEGLADNGVRVGHRYSLYWRAKKLCSAPKSKLKDRLAEIDLVEIRDYPKVTIEGKVIPKTIPGARFTFVLETSDSEEGMTVCGVEELVLYYHRHRDFPEGLHAEGRIVSTLFGFYFWDIIFMDIPDAFHSPFQGYPLDRHSDHFYQARKDVIDDRLEEIANMSEEDLEAVLAKVWEDQNGVVCRGLAWDRFSSLEHAQSLVHCMGGKSLSGLLRRYAFDPRNTGSGFPDLTLWNPASKTFKFSEVKGPGDRLSSNQIMWLDYLTGIGIDAEVCHVKAVTGKKLSRN